MLQMETWHEMAPKYDIDIIQPAAQLAFGKSVRFSTTKEPRRNISVCRVKFGPIAV